MKPLIIRYCVRYGTPVSFLISSAEKRDFLSFWARACMGVVHSDDVDRLSSVESGDLGRLVMLR